jgi:Ser/Thr protein kinase RdoA (MazF antagonist)
VIEDTQLSRRSQIARLRRVAERALAQYVIEPVSLSLLYHAYHTTFAVTERNGSCSVLHVLRTEAGELSADQRRARIQSEMWWLDRLRVDLDLPVPLAIRTPEGTGVVTVDLPDMAIPRLCSLFRWIDGRFLHHRLMPRHLHAVGSITARLHDHSMQLRVPTGFDRPTVDLADAQTEEPVVRLFTDTVSGDAADVMHRVLERTRAAQEEIGSGSDAFGLIHADIHQRNYLFQGDDVRLIDFGDCGWGHYLYDLAVTLSELEGLPNYAALRAALLAGYRSVRELSPAHESLIDTFIMLREVQNVTWFVKAREDPSYRGWATQIGERVAALERALDLEKTLS